MKRHPAVRRNLIRRHLIFIGTALVFALPAVFELAAKDKKDRSAADETLTMIDGVATDIVDVSVVNVDTYVTDKKGNVITDLTIDDFELVENGRPVPISNFYKVEKGQVTAGGLDVETMDVPEVERIGDQARVPEDQRLSLVVYVDNYNLHPFSRNRSFRFIRSFLRQNVKNGDRVMLISYDRELHERQPFTKDPELVAAALYDLEEVSAQALHRDSDRRDLLEEIGEADGILEVRYRVQTYAENQFNDLSFGIKALRNLVDQLAGLPGRKAVLYISDGLMLRPGEDLYVALDQRFPNNGMILEAFRYDMSRDFHQLTTAAASNRVTFYTLDAEGLRTYQYFDARNRTASGGTFVDQTHFRNLQSSLQLMAEETGGFAMINTNDFTKDLARMAEDFTSYYSLGFSPATQGSGRFNRLEVRVKGRKDLRVRHRTGYRDKAVDDRMGDSTLAALYHGYQKNAVGMTIEVESMTRRSDGNYDVALSIKLPIERLALLPQPDFHRGKVRFYIAARDSEGGLSEVQDVPLEIDIPTDQIDAARDKYYRYEVNLMMREGRQLVAVGMRDEIGAETAFISKGVMVGG